MSESRIKNWFEVQKSGLTRGQEYIQGTRVSGLEGFFGNAWEAVYAEDAYQLPDAWLPRLRKESGYNKARGLIRDGQPVTTLSKSDAAAWQAAITLIDRMLSPYLPKRSGTPGTASTMANAAKTIQATQTTPAAVPAASTGQPQGSGAALAQSVTQADAAAATATPPPSKFDPVKLALIAGAGLVLMGLYWRVTK